LSILCNILYKLIVFLHIYCMFHPSYSRWINLANNTSLKGKLWSSSMYNFPQLPVFSPLLGHLTNMLLVNIKMSHN
jgi:hypothetical protein